MRYGSVSSVFRKIEEKPDWARKISQTERPPSRYVVFFTPRSGSSRLTDVLSRAGGLGNPGESFNPHHFRKTAGALGAQDLESYVDLLTRRFGAQGVCGCELTAHHLVWAFGTALRFQNIWAPTAVVNLIRKDIVGQAVSASRMAQTGVGHRFEGTSEPKAVLDFNYRPLDIAQRIYVLLNMEHQTEGITATLNLPVLNLCYEDITQEEPAKTVVKIADHVGACAQITEGLISTHQKIGDERNLEFAMRFRAEHPGLMRRVEKERIHRLRAVAQDR